jgi:hypothetical protein
MSETGQIHQMSRLQRFLPLLLVISSTWVTVGRGLIGVGGWLFLVTFFVFLPVLLLYTTIISLVLRHKRKYGYVMSGSTRYVFLTLLSCMVLFGFTIVDGGDTTESVNSVLTVILHANNGTTDSPLFNISNGIASISLTAGVVLMLTSLIMLIKDKGILHNQSAGSTLTDESPDTTR